MSGWREMASVYIYVIFERVLVLVVMGILVLVYGLLDFQQIFMRSAYYLSVFGLPDNFKKTESPAGDRQSATSLLGILAFRNVQKHPQDDLRERLRN